jgi:hypothetical protein
MHTQEPVLVQLTQGDSVVAGSTRSRFVRSSGADFGSVLIASFVIVVAAVVCALSSSRFQHWFLIPVSLCGILIGIDAVEWLRGRVDLYDPAGIVGLLGVHYFFVAPLLHVGWDTWMDLSPPPDWRDWLGYMGILNAAGLILYRLARRFFKPKKNASGVLWQIDKGKFRRILPIFVIVSAVAQTLVYARFGGISGYMESRISSPESFVGLGWIFMISESAPILLAFFIVVNMQQRKISWTGASLALVVLFGVQMYFGGLRGSRSETVQLLFWVLGCIHFLIRPVPRRLVYPGFVFLIAFLYFYAFYKAMGKDAGEAITASQEDRAYLAQQKHKTFRGLVLWDMARADLQAYILYRLMNDGKDFDYAKGRTYLGSIAIWIPRIILPERPDTKLKEGTEIQYGSGYDPNNVSSHVYGMSAEAMLNFGPFAAPLIYGIFGLFIGWFKRAIDGLAPQDARFLLVPLGVYMCLGFLLGDSDNNAFGLAKNGLMPFLVVFLCSVRHRFRIGYRPVDDYARNAPEYAQ